MYPPHQTHRQTFEGGMNSDLADERMRRNMARLLLNCRVVSSAEGNEGIVTNMMGNVLISTPLPDGFCKTIATAVDEKNNKVYFGIFNDGGLHTWYVYDHLLNSIKILLQNLTDTNGEDIFKWSPDSPVLHVDIVNGELLYYCDALNKGRKFNITRALDKSITGYGLVITEDIITAYKKTAVYAPVPTYFTDITRNSNFLYAVLCKFCYRYIYYDGEVSNYSDWSMVALPPNQNYQGTDSISNDNNCIALNLNSGSSDVIKVEVAVKLGSLQWQTCAILNKEQLNIADESTYTFNFYNDGSYTAADQDKINRPYSFMFRVPICQSFVKLAMTYTGGDEGFPVVDVDMSIALSFQDLHLPPDTANQLNAPVFTVSELSYSTESALFVGTTRYDPVERFTIGHDVKAGNVFSMVGINGTNYLNGVVKFFDTHNLFSKTGTDHFVWTYTATVADTAQTVASRLKAYLRGTGRGIPQSNNGVSNESTDGDGNVSFNYSFFGKYKEQKTIFSANVTPINYVTLKDNGVSIQVIKSGSVRQYAVAYDDDDLKTSNGYTVDAAIIRTPFITESPGGILQQPIHDISIFNQPPIWAKYWRLLRTPDESQFIQMLVQKVITVNVISGVDQGEYLDMVIGSLFTYQQIHKDTILQYSFDKGDRLRLIRNTTTGAYYTPFFETTVLSYNEVTTEDVNASITVDGSAEVTPSDGVRPDYVGKNIQIGGFERTITGIDGAKYVLDNVINIGPTVTTAVVASYTFIDRRGIVRIAKPPVAYDVVDFSTIELYKPQKNTDNLDFKIFNDTAQKFEISDWGTDQRAHRGTLQDQDGTSAATLISTPAIVRVTEGDAYIRARELPTNTEIENTEVIVDNVEDPNFSDFYESNLNNLGRVYPKDDGSGQKHFGSRTRFSNNYIVDTKINGLNDFDDLDRVDNNDANGDVMLTKFLENKLFVFKKNKDCWMLVGQTFVAQTTGQQIIGTSDKLLGPLQYYEYHGGIGDNPESYFQNDNYQYHACASAATFVRVAGDGVDPISTEFGYDKAVRDIMFGVKKYKLRLPSGFDPKNDEGLWCVPQYIPTLYNNEFAQADWVLTETPVPNGSIGVVVTQPANGTVTWNGATNNFDIVMDDDFVGQDSFTYKMQYPDTTFSAVKNGCITVNENPNRPSGFQFRASSDYCRQVDGGNSGAQNWYILEGIYLDNSALTGMIMPNIKRISPSAIVPDGTTITYNEVTDVAPTGGADGDIWYNEPSDILYKKIAGVWTPLTDRSANDYYAPDIENTTDCPIPPPTKFYTAAAKYGGVIDSIDDGTCTGTPAALHDINLSGSESISVDYSGSPIGAGDVAVICDGMPALPGHINIVLYVNGVEVDSKPFTGPNTYNLTFGSTTTSPTPILITFETHT